MTIHELIKDLIDRYMLLGSNWQLFSYTITFLFMIGIVYRAKRKGMRAGKCIMITVLFLYLITVYLSTVIVRKTMPNASFRLEPFFSWKNAISGKKESMRYIVENIIMLMPIGFIIPLIVDTKKYAIKTISFGFGFSLFIEMSQYVFRTGLFEVDDLINNTVGVFIGLVILSVCRNFIRNTFYINEDVL